MGANRRENEPTVRESKSALLEAAQAAVEEQKTKATAARAAVGSTRIGFRALLLATAVAGAAVLLIRPPWLVGPEPVIETTVIQGASARLALVEAVVQIRAYVTKSGQLPRQPGDAGVTNRAISLRPLDNGEFELTLKAGDALIAVRSTDSLQPIVISAVRALQRRTG